MSRDLEDAEILSVVNEEDLVIGQRRRDEIHSLNLFHRSIHVLVFNSNGEIFLQQRGLLKQESPGLWASSVSGHVDAGESYDCLLYTSPSPRDRTRSRMPSSA